MKNLQSRNVMWMFCYCLQAQWWRYFLQRSCTVYVCQERQFQNRSIRSIVFDTYHHLDDLPRFEHCFVMSTSFVLFYSFIRERATSFHLSRFDANSLWCQQCTPWNATRLSYLLDLFQRSHYRANLVGTTLCGRAAASSWPSQILRVSVT